MHNNINQFFDLADLLVVRLTLFVLLVYGAVQLIQTHRKPPTGLLAVTKELDQLHGEKQEHT